MRQTTTKCLHTASHPVDTHSHRSRRRQNMYLQFANKCFRYLLFVWPCVVHTTSHHSVSAFENVCINSEIVRLLCRRASVHKSASSSTRGTCVSVVSFVPWNACIFAHSISHSAYVDLRSTYSRKLNSCRNVMCLLVFLVFGERVCCAHSKYIVSLFTCHVSLYCIWLHPLHGRRRTYLRKRPVKHIQFFSRRTEHMKEEKKSDEKRKTNFSMRSYKNERENSVQRP